MALTNAQRKRLLARVIHKALNGQLDADIVLNRLTAAVGDRLDDDLTAEALRWKGDLEAARAAAVAQVAQIDADLPTIGA